MRHEMDEDACCIHCNFDGAEWWHWRHMTWEGKASNERQPPCSERDEAVRAENRRRYPVYIPQEDE